MPTPAQISYNLGFMRTGAVDWFPWGQPFPVPLQGGNATVEQIFFAGSDSRIILEPYYVNDRTSQRITLDLVSPVDLHEELAILSPNLLNVMPIKNIGVIVAPAYRPKPGVLGMMFDLGFIDFSNPQDIPSSYRRRSREGCAVFVNAIRSIRAVNQNPLSPLSQASMENIAKQFSFTLIHELGHVFNLQHFENQPCFMNTSPAPGPAYGVEHFRFLQAHVSLLRSCPTNTQVQPGGDRFGVGDYFDSSLFAAGRLGQAAHLQMDLSLSLKEFARWQPVELQITIGVKGPVSISIPDEVDPGYKRFAIWIETPSGERRRYHPPRRYCCSSETLSLAAGGSFRRDVSIFAQSGGYTFEEEGEHLIFATMVLDDGSLLKSDPLSFVIQSGHRRDSRSQRRHDELAVLAIASAGPLYHRSGRMRRKGKASLLRLIEITPRSHLGASAKYALGCWFHDQALRVPKARKHWLQQAKLLLQKAADSPLLNEHRRERAHGKYLDCKAGTPR